MSFMRKIGYLVITCVLMSGIVGSSYAQSTADGYRASLFIGINNARETNGKTALLANDKLSRTAQTSIESVASVDDYAVVSTDTVDDLLQRENYTYGAFWYAMHSYVSTSEAAIELWMINYRDEILSDEYTELGVGYAENRLGDKYFMILLAKPGESVLPTTMPPACANPITPYPIAGQDLTIPQSPERVAKIRVLTDLYDSLAQNWLNDALVPGAVIGLIDEGEFVWVKAYGYSDANTYAPMTTDMIFGVASFSKPIASVAT
ncbi:MAG TPA: serine hydrolase, partial [Aggregatilineales bacterium]|nr:serine hydrolase [Aggregatilineales bacterium]